MPYTLGQTSSATHGGGGGVPRFSPEKLEAEIAERNRKYHEGLQIAFLIGGSTGLVSGSVAYAVGKRGRPILGALLGVGTAAAYMYGATFVLPSFGVKPLGMDGLGYLGVGALSTFTGAVAGALIGRKKQ